MSQLSDIKFTLSSNILRAKLTLHERAQLLCEILEDLDYNTYDIYGENGSFVGYNLNKAKKDLCDIDNEIDERYN